MLGGSSIAGTLPQNDNRETSAEVLYSSCTYDEDLAWFQKGQLVLIKD